MHIHHLGAAFVLLFMVPLFHAQSTSLQDSDPEFRAMFLSFSSDGTCLTKEQLKELLPSKFNQIQNLNDQLLEELILYFDADEDGVLKMAEFISLAKFITKERNR